MEKDIQLYPSGMGQQLLEHFESTKISLRTNMNASVTSQKTGRKLQGRYTFL